MSRITVGDAVMTPSGGLARVVVMQDNVAVLEYADPPAQEMALTISKFTRLTPDTGLEERVREWAEVTYHGSAAAEVLALLDTPEAEPEFNDIMDEDEPPPTAVTREEPTLPDRFAMKLRDRFAMAALTGLLAERCGRFDPEAFAADAYLYADAMLAARLRGEDEG